VRSLVGLALAATLAAAAPVAAEPWTLENSHAETIEASNGRPYRVLVAWPEGEPPASGWPVLWLLDGEDNFAPAALTARRLAGAGARTGIEPGLVVGIESEALAQRVYDYTPETPGYAIPEGLPAHGLQTGGGDTFLDALENELRPLVASRWSIDPERQTLAGHSFGGLLAIHALDTRRSFSAYAAISPSLWFGDGEWTAGGDPDARLFLARGTEERAFAPADAVQSLAERRHAARLPVEYSALEGHGHGTTMLAAMAAVIKTAFGRTM